MSRGAAAVSHYSSRNLEACTLQMSRWSPFISPSVSMYASGEEEGGEEVEAAAAAEEEGQEEDDEDDEDDEELANIGMARDVLPLGISNLKPISSRNAGAERSSWPSSASSSMNQKEICRRKTPIIMTMMMLPPSLSGGWNKRQKQLSEALSRGLWRWKEGAPASKRRRKCGSSRSCGGGSGRSSDSKRGNLHASDQNNVAGSGPYATCSDIPFPGTDSSGELFFYGDGWDSELPLGGTSEHMMHKRESGLDVHPLWIASETQSIESGYGSEPGYRGDGELGYEDDGYPDEQDEEEKQQQLRLSPWRENGSSSKPPMPGGHIFKQIAEEDSRGDITSSSESRVQHRFLRRRRHDFKPFAWQKSKHS